MPFPKLSAVLNNCPLHALTPELKDEILKFRDQENYDNQHNNGYCLLKDKFAEYYGFETKDFSWKQFADILEQYNPLDTQILMGPVLRLFMAATMPNEDDLYTLMYGRDNLQETEEYITLCTTIAPDTGRYESLSPEELFHFTARHLGITLQYFSQENFATYEVDNPVTEKPLQIYHQGGFEGAESGGHWERSLNGEDSISYDNDESTQLKAFLPLLGQDSQVNLAGFNLLKKHVRCKAENLQNNCESKEALIVLEHSASSIEKYIFNISSVSKTLAIKLLGDDRHDEVQEFIKNYKIPQEITTIEIYERWINAPSHSKPPLQGQEFEVLERLIGHPLNALFDGYLTDLQEKIENLGMRASELKDKRTTYHQKRKQTLEFAQQEAKTLHIAMHEAGRLYFSNPNENSYNVFKKSCQKSIGEARKTLDKHRGWSEFLINLALGIVTAGLGVLIKGAINTARHKHFFFVHQTQSGKIIDQLGEAIVKNDPSLKL